MVNFRLVNCTFSSLLLPIIKLQLHEEQHICYQYALITDVRNNNIISIHFKIHKRLTYINDHVINVLSLAHQTSKALLPSIF